MTRILAFAGSSRSGSLNERLARATAERISAAGATVTVVRLADFPMPLYDGDLEANGGVPEPAARLGALLRRHDGLLLACPEYNGSITPLLKNTIDWLSRPSDGHPPLAAFRGKVAGLVAASPGALGGLRGLVHVDAILSGIGVHVIPTRVAVPKAHEVLGEDDQVSDERLVSRLDALAAELVRTTSRLAAE